MLGNDLLILDRGGNAIIAYAKECEIECQADIVGVSNPDTGDWKEHDTEYQGWSINLSYLVSSPTAEIPKTGTTVSLRVRERASQSYLAGTGVFRQNRMTGTWGNITQGSFSIIGRGPLE